MKNQTSAVINKLKFVIPLIVLALLLLYSTAVYLAYAHSNKITTPLNKTLYKVIVPLENSYLFFSTNHESRAKKSIYLFSKRGNELIVILSMDAKAKSLSRVDAVNNTKDYAIKAIHAINNVSNQKNREMLTDLYGQKVFNLISHLVPFQNEYNDIAELIKMLFNFIAYFPEAEQIKIISNNKQIIAELKRSSPEKFKEIIENLPDVVKKEAESIDENSGSKADEENADDENDTDNGKTDNPVINSLSKAVETKYSISSNDFIIKHVRVLNAHNLYRFSLIQSDENYLTIIFKKNGANYEEVFTSTEMDWGTITKPNSVNLTVEEWNWLINYIPINDDEFEVQYK